MSLSTKAKRGLDLALRSKTLGQEVANAIDSSGSGPADNVSLIGATSDLAVDAPAASSLSDNMAATIDAALDLKADQEDVEALAVDIEARLDVIEAKIDLVITNLIAAGLMSAS